MEKYEEEILKKIDEDVSSNADLIRTQVETENENLHQDQLSFFKEGLKKETDTYLEKELAEQRFFAATKTSTDKMNTKKKLLALRQSLSDELFNDVRSDLKKFTKSAEYETWLRDRLREVPLSRTGYFLAREEDMDLLKKLLAEIHCDLEVKKGYPEIGGFVYADVENSVEYSCTLGEKLKEAGEWFRNHAEFYITESGENV